MPRYLLSCTCGTQIPVETSQAGESIACPECGAYLAVPPLRKLRLLPEEITDEPTAPAETWGARQGIGVVCQILAVVFLGLVAWLHFNEPQLAVFDPAIQQRFIDTQLDRIPPAAAWLLLVDTYQPLVETGFREFVDPRAAAIEAQIAKSRRFQLAALIAGLVFVATAIVVRFWPAGRKS